MGLQAAEQLLASLVFLSSILSELQQRELPAARDGHGGEVLCLQPAAGQPWLSVCADSSLVADLFK